MIFSIVCEELGLVGAVVLLAMFLFLIYHLIRIAVNSENLFGKVLVMGIAFHISLQVLINHTSCRTSGRSHKLYL